MARASSLARTSAFEVPMRQPSFVVVFALCCAAPLACERRHVPTVGDASTTAATAPGPRGELEPVADAGAAPTGAVEPIAPAPERPPVDERQRRLERAVQRAPLTIVQAGDRDRNLGITPAAPARIAVDGGACEVGIEIKRAP